ncbi:MAG: cysteine hydrolase [Anaerolineae bacterium]|nr:cysteine hydrolase [Anaerolineae bacterium]
MTKSNLLATSGEYLSYLDDWLAGLPEIALSEVVGDPNTCAIISVDVIEGFCHVGPLASPRVADIVAPITRLFESAWALGVQHYILTQDAHFPDAVEFAQFPPHCVRGTHEAETVQAFKDLPFFNSITVMEKNSIASGLNTDLDGWVRDHPEVTTYITVGDCTDLCTYQLAMHLRLDANGRQLQRRVILPVDCVDTYDIPVQAALAVGAYPHPAELLHAIFLNHLALNGVEVVKRMG